MSIKVKKEEKTKVAKVVEEDDNPYNRDYDDEVQEEDNE
jgi:hypothetical protein